MNADVPLLSPSTLFRRSPPSSPNQTAEEQGSSASAAKGDLSPTSHPITGVSQILSFGDSSATNSGNNNNDGIIGTPTAAAHLDIADAYRNSSSDDDEPSMDSPSPKSQQSPRRHGGGVGRVLPRPYWILAALSLGCVGFYEMRRILRSAAGGGDGGGGGIGGLRHAAYSSANVIRGGRLGDYKCVDIEQKRKMEEEEADAPGGIKKHNVLVTGGAGFVGMHTCIDLIGKGHNVVTVDTVNAYYSTDLKDLRVKEVEKVGVTFVKGDVCDSELMKKLILDHKVDRIIHLAAQAGVRYSLEKPLEYTRNNIDCFVELLEVVAHLPRPEGQSPIPIVYASSSSVYGLNTKVPFSETDPVIQQASLYGATKKSDELIAHVYHNLYKIPTVGLRFFTVYGPWGRPDMAIYKFTDKILRDVPIDMYNHGEMQRDFTYIDDIVDGVVGCLDLEVTKPEVLNLGNHRPEVLKRLISLIEQNLGKKAIINSKDMQPGDVPKTYADVTKAKCLIGYQPTTPLEEGIPKFVEWFKANNGAAYADK